MPDRPARCVAPPECLAVHHRLRPAILASASLFWAAPVYAVTVVVVRPPEPSPAVAETLVRLHGELLSVGLEVRIADASAGRGQGGTDSRAWLEQLAARSGASAVIDILGDASAIAVEVLVVDKKAGSYEESRVAVEPNTQNASERLAIRAIEVLRSSLIEIDWAARRPPGEPVAEPPSAAAQPVDVVSRPAHGPERVGLELGAAALSSLDGVGTAILPTMRVGWAVRPRFMVRAALAGLGTRPTVGTTAGHAQVAQQYAILGGCYRLRPDQRLRPFFALSAGVLHTSIDGHADSPNQGHSAYQWSFLLDGSVGTGLHLGGRYYLTVAAHVQVATPYVAIHIVDTVAASSGRPNLVLTLTVGAWL
jgi:hypothetical protein